MFHKPEKQLTTTSENEGPKLPDVDDEKLNVVLDDHDEILYEYVWLSDNEVMTEPENYKGQTDNCLTKLTKPEVAVNAIVLKGPGVENVREDGNLLQKHYIISRPEITVHKDCMATAKKELQILNQPNTNKTSRNESGIEGKSFVPQHDLESRPNESVQKDLEVEEKSVVNNLRDDQVEDTNNDYLNISDNIEAESVTELTETKKFKSESQLFHTRRLNKKNSKKSTLRYILNGKITTPKKKSSLNQVSQHKNKTAVKELNESANELQTVVSNFCKHIKKNAPTATELCTDTEHVDVAADITPETESSLCIDLKQPKRLETSKHRKHKITRLRTHNLPCDTSMKRHDFVAIEGNEMVYSTEQKITNAAQKLPDFVKDDNNTEKVYPNASRKGVIVSEKNLCFEKYRRKREFWIRKDKALQSGLVACKTDSKVESKTFGVHQAKEYHDGSRANKLLKLSACSVTMDINDAKERAKSHELVKSVGDTDEIIQTITPLKKDNWMRFMPTPTTVKLMENTTDQIKRTTLPTKYTKDSEKKVYALSKGIDDVYSFKDEIEDLSTDITDQRIKCAPVVSLEMKEDVGLQTKSHDKETDNNGVESEEIGRGVMLESKNENSSKKGKGMLANSLKTLKSAEHSLDQKRFENVKKTANAISTEYLTNNAKSASSKEIMDTKRKHDRRKHVKVLCTKNGVKKVSKRYPCRYCGELFTLSYVSVHEHKHGIGGLKKVHCRRNKKNELIDTDELADKNDDCKSTPQSDIFDNNLKSQNTSFKPKTKPMSGIVDHGLDIAKDTTDKEEKSEILDVKTNDETKSTETENVVKDSPIPGESATGSIPGETATGCLGYPVNNKMECDEIRVDMVRDKKYQTCKKGKDMYKSSVDQEKFDKIKKTATVKLSEEVKNSKRHYYRRKPVKVTSTRNGVKKISKRYPCRYCGELFTLSYVRFHERRHDYGRQKKVLCRRNKNDERMMTDESASPDTNDGAYSKAETNSFHNVSSGDPETEQMLGTVNHGVAVSKDDTETVEKGKKKEINKDHRIKKTGTDIALKDSQIPDGVNVAKGITETVEKGKDIEINKDHGIKRTGTDSAFKDSQIPDGSATGLLGDSINGNVMDSEEINGDMIPIKKDKTSKKRKDMHKDSLKITDKASTNEEKIDNRKKTATKSLSKNAKDFKIKYYRRKPVKVTSIKNGIKKISKRYPCRYCGELFTLSYVRFHERRHGIGGQKKVICRRNRNNEIIETEELADKSGECKSTTTHHGLDVVNDTEEKGENFHVKIKSTGTSSAIKDSTALDGFHADFQGDLVNEKMEPVEIKEGMVGDKKDKTNKKRKDSWRTLDESSVDTVNDVNIKKTATVKLSEEVKNSKRHYYRRKPVKVTSTKNGVKKILKRYPCRYCGELFTLTYVRFHERKHGTGGLQNVSFRNNKKDVIMDTSDLKIGQTPGNVNHSLDGDDVATVATGTKEKGKNNEVKSHNRIKGTGTDRIIKQFSIPGESTSGFYGDLTVSLNDAKNLQKKRGVKNKRKLRFKLTKNANVGSFSIEKLKFNQLTKSAVGENFDVKAADIKAMNNTESTFKRELDDSEKRENQHHAVQAQNCLKEEVNKVFKCTKCLYYTSYKHIYMRHLTAHNDKKIVSCQCGITFRSHCSLQHWHRKNKISYQGNHIHKKAKKRKQSREGPNLTIKKESSQTIDDVGFLKSVQGVRRSYIRQKCDKCKYRFSNRSNWLEHQLLHENDTGYSCKICGITMKSKQSLAFWHHRHGIEHFDSRRSKKNGIKNKVKIEKIEENEQKSCQTYDKECFKILQTSNNKVEKQERESRDILDGNNLDETEPLNKLEDESYFEVGMDNIVKHNEKLDGTINERFPQKLKMRQRSWLGRSPKALLSRNNRTENSEKSKKAESNRARCIESKLKEITDKESVLYNSQSYRNQQEDFDNESEAYIDNKRVESSLKLPVYPLVRKLSLKDGETVYSPVDDEIEIFEKECKVRENYRKVKVLNIERDGCLEIIKDGEYNEAVDENYSDDEEGGSEPVLNNDNEAVNNKPMNFSANRVDPNIKSVKDNQGNISLAFEIQIDLDRRHLSQQIEIHDDSVTSNCMPLNAKIIVKNLNVVGINQSRNIASYDGTDEGSNSVRVNKENGYQKVMKRNDLKKKIEIETEVNADDENEFNSHRNDFAYPDVEHMDEDIFYASKLQEKPYKNDHSFDKDIGYETFEDSLDIDMDRGYKAGNTSVCDTGERDENNNKNAGEKDGTRHRNSGNTGGSGVRDRGISSHEDGRNRGGRDDEGDGKENRDGNNNEKDRNGNHNVELLPCLVCQETFSNKTDLMRHLTKIHRLTNMCQICYFDEGEIRRFANPVSLRNHKVRDHPEDMVKCVCGAMLIDNKMLSSHLKKFKCNIYDTVGEANEMAKCICGKRFASQEFLFNHRSKCRKRHCKDESFLEYMSTSQQQKKRCLEPSTSGNMRSKDNVCMMLRAKVMKDNISMSEDSDTSHGRSSKGRKCKENVLTYSERLYDKFFETAVKSGSYKQSKRKSYSQLQGERRYERRSSCTPSLSNSNDVLDLRTKYVCDRNNNSVNESMGNNSQDINNNIPLEIYDTKSYQSVRSSGTQATQRRTKPLRRSSKKSTTKISHLDNQRLSLKKFANVKKQWALVRTTSMPDKSDKSVKYRCSWCRFVSVHWGTAVRHHYMYHQEKELDLICLNTIPKKSFDQCQTVLEKAEERVLRGPEKMDESVIEQSKQIKNVTDEMESVTDNKILSVKDNSIEGATGNNNKGVKENNIEGPTRKSKEGVTENNMESVTENNIECVTESSKEGVTENNIECVTENNIECVTESSKEGVTENNIECVIENNIECVTGNNMESVTENNIECITESSMEGVTENNLKSITENYMEGVTGEKIECEAAQNIKHILEDNMESVLENNFGSVKEYSFENVSEQNVNNVLGNNNVEIVPESNIESNLPDTIESVTKQNMENDTEQKRNNTVEYNIENVKDLKSENFIECAVESGIEQNSENVMDQNTEGVMTNTLENVSDNTNETVAEQNRGIVRKLHRDNLIDLNLEINTKLNKQNVTEQNMETDIEQSLEHVVEQNMESVPEPNREYVPEPNRESVTEPNGESVREPNRESVTENVTDHNMEGINHNSISDPKVENAVEVSVESVTETTTKTFTEQSINSETEQRIENSTTNTMESVSEQNIELVKEQKTVSVIDQNIESMTEQNMGSIGRFMERNMESVTEETIESATERNIEIDAARNMENVTG